MLLVACKNIVDIAIKSFYIPVNLKLNRKLNRCLYVKKINDFHLNAYD